MIVWDNDNPTPFEDMINQVICGDCLDVMKHIPDKSVDLVLTDPPYGLGVKYNSFEDTQDNLVELVNKFIPELFKISERIVLTCGHTNMWSYPAPTWVMAWVNPAGNNRNSWGFTCWQPILCYGKDPYLKNGKGARHDIIIKNESSIKVDHPCPKPEDLWGLLCERVGFDCDIILDPFLGSGTTAVIAKKFNKKFIGIEKDKKYCEIAERRLAQEYLF